MPTYRYPLLLAATAALAACGGDRAGRSAGDLATVFDSTTGDTIRARVQGTVDSAALRTLSAEWRLSGEVGDSIRFGTAGQVTAGVGGVIAFVDYSSNVVLLVDADGTLRGPMGGTGGGPGEYQDVSGLVPLPDGRWALYDVRNSRLSFFGADGRFETSWPLPASTFFGQFMLAADADGTLRVSQMVAEPDASFFDARVARARVLDGGRSYADTVLAPTFGIKASEYRATREVNGGRSSTLITDRLSAREFTLWHPDGHWVLLEGGTYRLLFARRGDRPLVVERSAPPIPVDPDERAWQEEQVLWTMRRTDPAWTWQGPPIASTRAPARSAFVGRDGRVWVQVALPAERIPEPERDPARENSPPPVRWRSPSAYEVYARDGRFLGRVTLPRGANPQAADGDVVWGTQLDEDDVATVVRWRVVPGLGQ
jgi:hypothetical protein